MHWWRRWMQDMTHLGWCIDALTMEAMNARHAWDMHWCTRWMQDMTCIARGDECKTWHALMHAMNARHDALLSVISLLHIRDMIPFGDTGGSATGTLLPHTYICVYPLATHIYTNVLPHTYIIHMCTYVSTYAHMRGSYLTYLCTHVLDMQFDRQYPATHICQHICTYEWVISDILMCTCVGQVVRQVPCSHTYMSDMTLSNVPRDSLICEILYVIWRRDIVCDMTARYCMWYDGEILYVIWRRDIVCDMRYCMWYHAVICVIYIAHMWTWLLDAFVEHNTHTHTHTHAHTHMHTHTYTHTHAPASAYVCMDVTCVSAVCGHVHMQVCVCLCLCTHMHDHTEKCANTSVHTPRIDLPLPLAPEVCVTWLIDMCDVTHVCARQGVRHQSYVRHEPITHLEWICHCPWRQLSLPQSPARRGTWLDHLLPAILLTPVQCVTYSVSVSHLRECVTCMYMYLYACMSPAVLLKLVDVYTHVYTIWCIWYTFIFMHIHIHIYLYTYILPAFLLKPMCDNYTHKILYII